MTADPRLARARQAAALAKNSTTPPPSTQTPPRPQTTPTRRPDSQGSALDGMPNAGVFAEGDFKLTFCTVCASNNNRSMEGHLRLAEAKYPVISFGTGSLVRLPGPSADKPNIFHFNESSYDNMYKELEEKDPRLYQLNGLLKILSRNRQVKLGPERWQSWRVGEPRFSHSTDMGFQGAEAGLADVVITCEERCWETVLEDLHNRGSPLNRPVHVINMDIKDSHEEGLVGGKAIVDIAGRLNRAANEERHQKGAQGWENGSGDARASFDERVPDILAEWQQKWPQFPAVWTLAWF